MQQDWNTTATMIRGTFIEKQIKRTNRNLLITAMVLFLGVMVYYGFNWRYYYNFFHGPLKMSAETLDHVTDPGNLDRYFVTLTAENEVDTGYTEVETSSSGTESVKARYVVIDIGEHHLIVKKAPDEKGPEYTGALTAMPGDVQASILGAVEKENPEAARDFHPYILDTTNFRHDGYWGLGISIPFLLMALWMLRKLVMRTSSPEQHPILLMLAHHGPVADVVQKIEAELKGEVQRYMQLKVTREWLFYSNTHTFRAMRLDEIVWVYKKITKRRVNFVPVGKDNSLVVMDRFAVYIDAPGGKEKKLDEFMGSLIPRLPNAVVGYNEELKKLQLKDAKAFAQEMWEHRARG